MGLQEGLLGRSWIGQMEGGGTGHAPHAEDMQRLALIAELGLGLVPIDLGLLPPGVGLRDEGLLAQESERRLPDANGPAGPWTRRWRGSDTPSGSGRRSGAPCVVACGAPSDRPAGCHR